jgi:predicted phosphodiesterase
MRIGIISDTHCLLRREAIAQLTGADHIIHAGDIGAAEVIDGLRKIAPTTASKETSIEVNGQRNIPRRNSSSSPAARFTWCTIWKRSH